jgi:hypothetical protein
MTEEDYSEVLSILREAWELIEYCEHAREVSWETDAMRWRPEVN